MNWTKDDEKKLIAAVSSATSVPAAVDAARLALRGKHLTYDAISNKLRRMGQRPLSELVKRPSNPSDLHKARPVAEDVAAFRMRGQLETLTARNKQLVEALATKDDELAAFKALARPAKPIAAPKKVGRTQRVGVPVMLCSDWHVEEPVDPKKVNGLNEYNLDIADRCIDKLAHAFADMIADSPRFDVRSGVIWLGGDLMSGTIHPELAEANEMSAQETQLWLLDRIERMLRTVGELCPQLERIVVPCNDGNHGRATEKIRVSTRTANSNEMVVYQTLARLFRNDKRFEFVIADGEWVELDVLGFTHAFTHGDSFKYGGGVGGAVIPIRRGVARQFQGRKVHQVCMGHFHQRQDFGDIQLNGSMIGYGPYSQRIHAAPEPRQQSWWMVDSERGKCLSAPIWL